MHSQSQTLQRPLSRTSKAPLCCVPCHQGGSHCLQDAAVRMLHGGGCGLPGRVPSQAKNWQQRRYAGRRKGGRISRGCPSPETHSEAGADGPLSDHAPPCRETLPFVEKSSVSVLWDLLLSYLGALIRVEWLKIRVSVYCMCIRNMHCTCIQNF